MQTIATRQRQLYEHVPESSKLCTRHTPRKRADEISQCGHVISQLDELILLGLQSYGCFASGFGLRVLGGGLRDCWSSFAGGGSLDEARTHISTCLTSRRLQNCLSDRSLTTIQAVEKPHLYCTHPVVASSEHHDATVVRATFNHAEPDKTDNSTTSPAPLRLLLRSSWR